MLVPLFEAPVPACIYLKQLLLLQYFDPHLSITNSNIVFQFSATREPKPIKVAPPTQTKPPSRKYSEEYKTSETTNVGPHRPVS